MHVGQGRSAAAVGPSSAGMSILAPRSTSGVWPGEARRVRRGRWCSPGTACRTAVSSEGSTPGRSHPAMPVEPVAAAYCDQRLQLWSKLLPETTGGARGSPWLSERRHKADRLLTETSEAQQGRRDERPGRPARRRDQSCDRQAAIGSQSAQRWSVPPSRGRLAHVMFGSTAMVGEQGAFTKPGALKDTRGWRG